MLYSSDQVTLFMFLSLIVPGNFTRRPNPEGLTVSSYRDSPPRRHSGQALTPDDLRHLIVDDEHGLLLLRPQGGLYQLEEGDDGLDRRWAISGPPPLAGRLLRLRDPPRLASYLKFVFCATPSSAWSPPTATNSLAATTAPSTGATAPRSSGSIAATHPRPRPRGHDVSFRRVPLLPGGSADPRQGPFNEHWERVHQLCHPCLVHYDVVGKYETLQQDAQYVLKLAGAGDKIHFPALAKDSRTTGDTAAGFFSSIGPFYQRRLYSLYHMDFLLFNYSTPTYLQLR
uniref:Carbohydrate sulfotransferase n=1 Tax=Denticeps clupeoides TaxID=299321 RepID=A0AAY4BV26_9TELE